MSTVTDGLRIIDTDTHVSEPEDLWTSRVSTKRWGDLVPHAPWDPELRERVWWYGNAARIYHLN